MTKKSGFFNNSKMCIKDGYRGLFKFFQGLSDKKTFDQTKHFLIFFKHFLVEKQGVKVKMYLKTS